MYEDVNFVHMLIVTWLKLNSGEGWDVNVVFVGHLNLKYLAFCYCGNLT